MESFRACCPYPFRVSLKTFLIHLGCTPGDLKIDRRAQIIEIIDTKRRNDRSWNASIIIEHIKLIIKLEKQKNAPTHKRTPINEK